jgi:hypothetical protein
MNKHEFDELSRIDEKTKLARQPVVQSASQSQHVQNEVITIHAQKSFECWLLLYAYRQRSILGAAGFIIPTPTLR